MEIARGRLAIKYIFFEMLPSFILGVLVFISILLMFQALRLTEFILIHGGEVSAIAKMISYLSISFLPVILPMSLLFSVLLTYGRLSNDSEIIAMRSLGLSFAHLTLPTFILSSLVALGSAQTSFYLAPWGNRKFELMINELSQLKASATIKEGIFSEGFFDLVIYANQIDEKKGHLKKVFIYDERSPKSPITIIAKEGQVLKESSRAGHSALLRLTDGNIHRTAEATYTKIDFQSYDISLFDPTETSEKQKSLPSLTIQELSERLSGNKLEPQQRIKTEIEYHRRISLSFACLIFGLIGVGLGVSTNRRSGKSSGLVLCLVVIVTYWIAYVSSEGLAKSHLLPASIALWLVNIAFGSFAIYTLKKASR